jgi:cell fate regulator YaaT (PSP1 superfamily)
MKSNYYSIILRKNLSKVAIEHSEELKPDQWVVFESEGILDIGKVEKQLPKAVVNAVFKNLATIKDLSTFKNLDTEEEKLSQIFNDQSKSNGLNMQLIDAQVSFDEKKITYYFSAEGRIDFRNLLRDLVKATGKLIRLQQIGPRDNAKLLKGSYGICGRQLCCQKFLKDLGKVTAESAQHQCLHGGSVQKTTGCCGKLMCCMAFEDETYRQMLAKYPKIGQKVKTKKGIGQILSINPISGKIVVNLENGDTIEVIKKL